MFFWLVGSQYKIKTYAPYLHHIVKPTKNHSHSTKKWNKILRKHIQVKTCSKEELKAGNQNEGENSFFFSSKLFWLCTCTLGESCLSEFDNILFWNISFRARISHCIFSSSFSSFCSLPFSVCSCSHSYFLTCAFFYYFLFSFFLFCFVLMAPEHHLSLIEGRHSAGIFVYSS